MKNSLVKLFAVCLIIIPSLSFSYSGSDIYKKVSMLNVYYEEDKKFLIEILNLFS